MQEWFQRARDHTAPARAVVISPLIRRSPRKAGYICTQHFRNKFHSYCLAGFYSVSYAARKYHYGSTSAHKNRSPQKQGRVNHAIGYRPESASPSKTGFPPAPTQNWAFQAGTTGFIDMPFGGFLGPPWETADLTRILRRRLAIFSIPLYFGICNIFCISTL